MAKKLCKNCKYWNRYTDKRSDPHLGQCSNENFVYIGDGEKTPVTGLGYWDIESYNAGFETGENFGCIHFESKVKENG